MARRTLDEREKPKPRRPAWWLWLVLAGIGLVSILGVGAVVAVVVMAAYMPSTKVWDKEDLKTALMGKTASETKDLLGVPAWTSAGDPDTTAGLASFTYSNRVMNRHTGKTDNVVVEFENHRVCDVR